MSRYGMLAKNSAVFAIANIGSHFITFLLVRFYTELLTAAEYGIVDFFVTTSSVLIPLLTLAITEAVLRFGMDNDDKAAVLTNGLFVALVGSLVMAMIGPAFFRETDYERYFIYLILMILSSSINSIEAQFTRGIGKVAIFAVAGIVKTATLVCGNLFFLLVLGWGIEGYLLSVILSDVASAIYLTGCAKLYRYIRIKWDGKVMRDMLCYSIPLVPNSLSWWVMNAADKYIIIARLGTAANGLYAVAHKIPSIINICNSIFFQAWQLSAVKEASSESKSAFYSNVFRFLSTALFLVASVLLSLLKPITRIMVADSYGEAWRFIPFLIIAMVFSAFSGFLGTNYVAMKKTNGALKTSLLGAAVNIVLNSWLVGPYGINGAAFATMVSFLTMWIYRAYDTKSFVVLNYDIFSLIAGILLLLIQSIVIVTSKPFYFSVLCTIMMVVIHARQTIKIVQMICKMIKKKIG